MEKRGVLVKEQINGLKAEIKKIDDALTGMMKLGQAKVEGLQQQRDMFQQQIEELEKLNNMGGNE